MQRWVNIVLLVRGNTNSRVSEKLEITRRLKNGESQSDVMASYNIGLSTMGNIKKCKDLFDCLWYRRKCEGLCQTVDIYCKSLN